MKKPFFKKTKRLITFIELLIAMALTSLILTVLFYFYRDIDWLNQEMEKSQKEAFKLSYVQNRLADVLPNVVSPKTAEDDFYFYLSHDSHGLFKTGNSSLVFTYNFGPNRDPQFANHDLGRIYLDQNNNLCLATLPSPKRWSGNPNLMIKNEVLMENVESLSFKFYVPPQKDRSKATRKTSQGMVKGKMQSQDIQPKDAWHTDWKSEYHQLPALVQINLKVKSQEEPVTFTYPFPLSDFIIVYDR